MGEDEKNEKAEEASAAPAKAPRRSASPAPGDRKPAEGEEAEQPAAKTGAKGCKGADDLNNLMEFHAKTAVAKPKGSLKMFLMLCLGLAAVVVFIVALLEYAEMLPSPVFGIGKGHELTLATWATATTGKTVFVKFYAPWCGHCKRMKKDWTQLRQEYAAHEYVLVTDVDCINAGKSLCDEIGVKGFPTLKYGASFDLQDYSGGRSYKELAEFTRTLKPACSADFPEHCTEESKAQLEKFQAMSAEERQESIKEKEENIAKVQADFNTLKEKTQKDYLERKEAKEAKTKEIKESLSLMKAVAAFQAEEAKKQETA